jgi:hypothetical protein
MTGNLMCELLACDRGEVLLCPDKLLRGEPCLDGGGSTTGYKIIEIYHNLKVLVFKLLSVN